MNDKAQSRLYFVTAIACFVWLVQSVRSAIADGMLWHWSNIIFVLCIAAVVTYCVYQGIAFNKKARLTEDAEAEQFDDVDNSDETNTNTLQ